jgi:hypothetical protein
VNDELITKDSTEREFEGWEAWQGIDHLWHARIRGATPPVMVWERISSTCATRSSARSAS